MSLICLKFSCNILEGVLPCLFISMIVCLFGENTDAHNVLSGLEGRGYRRVRKFLEGLGIWETHIKNDFKEIAWEGMDWYHQAQDREKCRAVTNTEMKLQVPESMGKLVTRLGASLEKDSHACSNLSH